MDNPQRSYEYILKEFGEDTVRDRYEFIYDLANDVRRRVMLVNKTRVDPTLVSELILDYFADIGRLKDFHQIERTNPVKVAAYTAHWILKRQPIQIIVDLTQEEIQKFPMIPWVNQLLARAALFSMAFDTSKKLSGDWTGMNLFNSTLGYHFIYRHTNSQMLELILYALKANPIWPPLVEPNP